ncbi:MAG: CHAP domain-containing protein [Clostridiales bacterium]|nr:CHAP domain-containing protein [Clostridiales bacterium]
MKRIVSLWLGAMLFLGCLPAFAQDAPAPIPDLVTVEESLAAQENPPANAGPSPEENWEVLPEPERPEFVPLLMDIARSELGYVEGSNNYSKYGEWAGDPNAAWCAEFVCWCVNQTDLRHDQSLLNQVYPKYSGQNTGKEWFIARGRFLFRKAVCPDWGPQWLQGADRNLMKNEYHPRSGDLLFFSYNEAGDTEHVALVEFCARHEDGQIYVHVLEGNNPDRVQRNHYPLDDSQVLGYGLCEDIIGTSMRFGNTGDKVLLLQEKLHELGYLEDRHLTGTYGSNTRAAVLQFQREAMYEDNPNGIANLYTQRAIDELLEEKRYNSRESWLVTD